LAGPSTCRLHTDQLELRFRAPSRSEGEVQFVTTVDLR
jgi:hypothetical protein